MVYKKTIYIAISLLLLLALFGCTNTALPKEYTVNQFNYNSGYAGVEGTGEYDDSIEITITESTIPENYYPHEILKIEDIQNKKTELEFSEIPIEISNTQICYKYEQVFVKAAVICEEDGIPFYYREANYKGNHQSESFEWYTKQLPETNCSFNHVYCPVDTLNKIYTGN